MFNNVEKPSCIDLILTNCPRSFQMSCAIETRLSDFCKIVVTAIRTTCTTSPPKIIIYHNCKHCNNESFREELLQIQANRNNCDENFKNFTSSCNVFLNKEATRKSR